MSVRSQDLDFIVYEKGSLAKAITYCDRIASLYGPLSRWYEIAAELLRKRGC